MLRVGLTGGIAAGKSTVSRRLDALGALLIDADVIAREVVEPGTPGFDAVVAEFGRSVVGRDGSLDRPALGRLVFADGGRREALNAIVHPLVYARRTELVEAAPPDAIVVEDVPLLVENGLAAAYHLVIVVHAPERERIRRLVDDRGMAEADARARIAAQAGDDARRAAADVWLDNVDTPAALEVRVDDVWEHRLVPFEDNLRHARPARRDPQARPEPVPPDPTWPGQAERLAARLRRVAGEHPPQISHVGPTAEPGRPAPDVIDLEVIVPDTAAADALTAAAGRAGFVPWPTGSTTDRLLVEADPGRPVDIRLKFSRPCRSGRFPVRPRTERVRRGPGQSGGITMKYMLIMRATDEAYAGMGEVDVDEMIETVGRFNDEMIRAGVLLAAEGLDDPAESVVVDYASEVPVVTDGPYGETKELFGGFYILNVASKEEAVEWAKRLPATGPGFKTEIRRVSTIDEFPQDNEWIQKERAWRESTGQL